MKEWIRLGEDFPTSFPSEPKMCSDLKIILDDLGVDHGEGGQHQTDQICLT